MTLEIPTDHKWSSYIEAAFRAIPKEFHNKLSCDFLVGKTPLEAGIHDWEETMDGRNLQKTSHVCYPRYLAIASSKPLLYLDNEVINPRRYSKEKIEAYERYTVVHELGHVLHYYLDEANFGLPAVTAYAESNHWETFAEAFCAYIEPKSQQFLYGKYEAETAKSLPDLVDFFESLKGLKVA